MSSIKRVVVAAVCAALGIVLPMAFHAVPGAGNAWLPMHLPVMICGLVAGPAASSLLTGMPAAPMLPSMICELVVYGLVSGLLSSRVRTGRLTLDLYVSLVGAMVCGRVVGGLLQALIFSAGSYSLGAWAAGYLLTGLPGIVLQLAVVVPVAVALERAGLVEPRYPQR